MKIKLSNNIEIVHNSLNVMTVYVSGVSSGFELPILLRADAHHDDVYCDRAMEKGHLDKIKEQNGFIIDVGDLFTAMQGKYDPRKSYDGLRPEYKVDNYFDAIVTDAAKFYAPYAKNFLVISPGNHESAVLDHNAIDLTNNLVYRMNSDNGSHIQVGGYGGYVRFIFDSGKSQTKLVKYFHGYLGNQSMNSINREATIYPDADVIVNGDSHDSWHIPIARERVSERGVVTRNIQHHIRTASYLDMYRDGSKGWWVQKGGKPKPLGAVWMTFVYRNHQIDVDVQQVVR